MPDANLSDLSNLLQGEINKRKLFEDGKNMVDAVIGLEQRKNQAQNDLDKLKAEQEEIIKANDDYRVLSEKDKQDFKKYADTIKSDAKNQASKIVAKAETDAEGIVSAAKDSIAALDAQIIHKKSAVDDLEKDIKNKSDLSEAIRADIESQQVVLDKINDKIAEAKKLFGA